MTLLRSRLPSSVFQSTRPARGATGGRSLGDGRADVSIHAPRTGRDLLDVGTRDDLSLVSIHAPRTGRDGGIPCNRVLITGFQSTRPARGATVEPSLSALAHSCFNPRAPHGARRLTSSGTVTCQTFQSTRPARGATLAAGDLSIIRGFQSTRPARGATYPHAADPLSGRVSIHAPRTGRDNCGDFHNHEIFRFQSTRPARGATRVQDRIEGNRVCFNPRAPHGARLGRKHHRPPRETVSIHAPRTGRDDMSAETQSARVPVSIHAPRTGRDSCHHNR